MAAQTQAALHELEIVRNEAVADAVFRMLVEAPELCEQISAGQFINLQVAGDASELLRIPLSFSRVGMGVLELLYAVVGAGTERLSQMREGQRLSAVGPCGVGWSVPEHEGRILLVAGGVGISPILAASELLVEANYGFDVVVGASTAGKLWEEGVERLRSAALRRSCDCARRVYVTTDDGSLGVHGFVTDAIEPLIHEREYEQVWACGPDPMMRSVAQQAHDAHTDCMVSLERTMGCGFGVCAGCNVELAQGGYALCCSDGPVFNARELAW